MYLERGMGIAFKIILWLSYHEPHKFYDLLWQNSRWKFYACKVQISGTQIQYQYKHVKKDLFYKPYIFERLGRWERQHL